ncbi:MAG: class I SAM-dependent methyltransferase [Myxococcota bacterium]
MDHRDRFLDLGCGRGKLVMLAAALGVEAEGIEIIPQHLQCARWAARGLARAHFREDDLRFADLGQATIFWVTGTCWDEPTCDRLADRIVHSECGRLVISVSAPLKHPQLQQEQMIQGRSTWGRTRIYIQRILRHNNNGSLFD